MKRRSRTAKAASRTKAKPRPQPAPARDARTLDDIQADPYNANRGTERGREVLRYSLLTHGAGRSVLLDRASRTIAGNKTVEEARRLATEGKRPFRLKVVDVGPDDLVAVRRRDLVLEDPRARELGLLDNEATRVGLEYDPAKLRELQATGIRVAAVFGDDGEFERLLGLSRRGKKVEVTVKHTCPKCGHRF